MCKKLICLAVVLLMLAISVSMQAAVFSDDFEKPRDYIAEGVQGTGWDGFVGLGPRETVDALNASVDRAGQLYLASTGALWHAPWDPLGPYLYKIIEGDFIATVKVVDYAGTEGAEVYYNDGHLAARVPNPADENGNNGRAFGLDPWLQIERVGNTFHFRTSADGLFWTEMAVSPITRDDMAGLPLQVGIRHATYSDAPGYIAFDNFSIEGPLVVPGFKAYNPNPAEEVVDVPRDSDLIWTPAATAVAHDVYFGTVLDDVNDADRNNSLGVLVRQGQEASTYEPADLFEFGQTYYWRVDEVEADGTILTGSIWSFTAEPVAYPIAGENITATASSSADPSQGPENTVNGSGLIGNLHSTVLTDMWFTAIGEPAPAWIQYDFDKAYKLHEMLVWNYNGQSFLTAIGLKDVVVEYSSDGTNWMQIDSVNEFVRASGLDDYAPNTTVALDGISVKSVKIYANSNWSGGFSDQFGLSEVQFLYIPVRAREPDPDSGTTDVAVDVTLGFRAGRDAAEHNVYLSSDEQVVIDGNAPVTTVTEASYGPLSLDLGKTYYWKINEVNEAEIPTMWQGEIWNFSTPEFFVVDGFEDYNDYPPDEIWSTWVDGYGVPANGATVGYPNPDWNQDEHYVETAIVHGGSQAMPFFYSNTGGATHSEGACTFAVPQDWTKAGVQTLTLWFYGDPNNAASQMYVKVNGSKVLYDGNATNLALMSWQLWNIDLALFGVDLQNVTTLAIGIDGSGASGTLYFDDIRLYRLAPPPVSEWRITAGSDDAEEDVGGSAAFEIDLTSTDLELMHDNNPADPLSEQVVGLRFVGIPIPKGSTITEAWVQFDADDVDDAEHVGNAYILIDGELNPDPVTFENTPNNITGRPRTTSQVQWTSEPWPADGGTHQKALTADISSIIQEIVDQDGWVGSALVLIFSQDPATPSVGHRECESFDGAGSNIDQRPTLHITYQ